MTRDIQWGIPVPLDDPDARGKVLFVWFDAPIGYISFTAQLCQDREGDWNAYQKWWCDPDTDIVHFIGEDNTVFHALIWPAMLMADGRHQLPAAVVANNFVNIRMGAGDHKVSKSKTAEDSPVWIEEYLKRGLDPDALRYYLTATAPETARTTFDPREFVQRNNGELVAAFGNFANRTLAFAARYLGGRVPGAVAQTPKDAEHVARGETALHSVGANLEAHRYRAGLEEMMAYVRLCNEFFSLREPWRTRQEDPEDCGTAIATCIHAVHALAIMSYPFLPGAARRLLGMLNVPDQTVRWQPPAPLSAGHVLGQPAILFPKLEPGCVE